MCVEEVPSAKKQLAQVPAPGSWSERAGRGPPPPNPQPTLAGSSIRWLPPPPKSFAGSLPEAARTWDLGRHGSWFRPTPQNHTGRVVGT